jgi:DNA-binding response OmpR family regulator
MTRILIVEDEERVRKMYSAMLKNEGFDVIEAPDAIEASNILNKEPIDIMLLDINMPQVYGSVFFEVAQNFHKKVKVIVASVYSVDEQKKMIKGAEDYYDKSQGLDLLLEKIKRLQFSLIRQTSILVIDDEPRIRKIYRHYLQENGYRIIEAHNGNVGLDILRRSKEVALVILDLAMPQKSGLEIYEQMKKEFPGIKIIISSVFSQDDQKQLLPGADGYYDKSENAAGLIEKIKILIGTNSPA